MQLPYQVFRYAGIQDGWVAVTSPAPAKQTHLRFRAYSAVNGHMWHYKVDRARSSVFGIQLPSFV